MTKAREVEVILKNKGVERGTALLIIELFERIATMEVSVAEFAVIQLKSVEQLSQVVDGAGAIRKEVERMQQRLHSGDDDSLPPRAS